MTDQTERQKVLTLTGRPASCLTITLLIVAWSTLGGCSQAYQWNDADRQPQPRSADSNQRSLKGNPPFYEVFGQRYYVMDSSYGFEERGVASWYGKKFHGRQTSSGAIYDMHAMTAAHKTLPLPSKVHVRNLKNGRSVTVTVNDRGPFVDNRIIDLSYAAATQLDMIREGTALVEIAVVTDSIATVNGDIPATETPLEAPAAAASISLYLQVGAFGEQSNAQQLLDRLHGSGFQKAVIHSETASAPSIYRVRLGPIADVAEYDELIEKMAALEIVDTHLVSESGQVPGT